MSDKRSECDVLACLGVRVIMSMSCGGGGGGGGTDPDDTPPAVTLTEPSPDRLEQRLEPGRNRRAHS